LTEKLELLVQRLSDKDLAQRENALKLINEEIKGATKTMTSVPKPLKFLSPLYEDMLKAYESQSGELKVGIHSCFIWL
jgi:26S proteasome regulatory subunit N1